MDCVPTFFLFIIKHGKEINWVDERTTPVHHTNALLLFGNFLTLINLLTLY